MELMGSDRTVATESLASPTQECRLDHGGSGEPQKGQLQAGVRQG